MDYVYDDGGRKESGYKGFTGDCLTRAISIVTMYEYQTVYNLVNEFGSKEHKSKRRKNKSSARTGVYKNTVHKIMKQLGFKWVPTMFIGSGCRVHLKESELPSGKIICALSKHYTSVIDGVIHDTYDPSRDETRCVYGYYIRSEK